MYKQIKKREYRMYRHLSHFLTFCAESIDIGQDVTEPNESNTANILLTFIKRSYRRMHYMLMNY